MDRRHHTIQLSTGPGSAAAATRPRDDGMMSSKLYLAVCGGRNEEALALLAADQAAGKICLPLTKTLALSSRLLL